MNRACRNELCADHEPLDLSARGAGEVLRQRQKLRPVLLGDSKLRQVVGYVLEAELLLRRSWDNQRMAALAEPLIGDADDHDVLHLRQITDDVDRKSTRLNSSH